MTRTYLEREEPQDELDRQVAKQVTADRHHGDGSRLHPLTSLRRITKHMTYTRMLAPLSYVIGHMNIYLFYWNNATLLTVMVAACMITRHRFHIKTHGYVTNLSKVRPLIQGDRVGAWLGALGSRSQWARWPSSVTLTGEGGAEEGLLGLLADRDDLLRAPRWEGAKADPELFRESVSE